MCGIGAILDPGGAAPPEAAQHMVEALRHRGPDGDAVKRLGPAPRVLSLRVDGGSTIELAAAEPDELRMLGPFAGAAVPPPANR